MTRVEVRCCCRPEKLLGWLQVPEEQLRAGNKIGFMAVATVNLTLADGPGVMATVGGHVVELPVEYITLAGATIADAYLALKSEETPIETLRQIRGFVENL